MRLALDDHEEFADAHFFLGFLQMSDFALLAAGDNFTRALEIGLQGQRLAEAHFRLGLVSLYREESRAALSQLAVSRAQPRA